MFNTSYLYKLFLVCCILTLSIFQSCKKSDANLPTAENTIEKRFFTLPNNASPELLQLANKIKADNDIHHFITSLVKKNGYPLWENALGATSSHNLAKAGKSTEGQGYFIPFKKDGAKSITSYVSALISPETILIKLFNREYYNDRAKNEIDSTKQLKFLRDLAVFGYFEKSINNVDTLHLKGTIRPKIFNVNIKYNKSLIAGRNTGVSCSNMYMECYDWTSSGPVARGSSAQDFMCVIIFYNCVYEPATLEYFSSDGNGAGGWYDAGVGPTGGGGSTGGGATGGGSTSSSDPLFDSWVNGYPILSDGIVVRYNNYNNQFWNDVNYYSSLLGSADVKEVNTSDLRNIARMRGWDQGITPVEFNRKVGKAFEETALNFFGFTENGTNYPASQRAQRNVPNPPTMVRPDALDNYLVHWYDQGGSSHFDQLEKCFGVEVKAYNGTLELSTNSWQILGELELIRKNFDDQVNSPYWQQLNPPLTIDNAKIAPCLLFITTGDTEIGQSIIDKAAELKIAIWQVKATHGFPDSKMSFGDVKYVYDKAGIYPKGSIVPGAYLRTLIRGAIGIGVPPIQFELTPDANFSLDPEEAE